MRTVRVTSKQIKQFCTPEIQIKQGFFTQNGDPIYVKFLRNKLIDQLDISECLEFNRCVLGQPQEFVFPNHFLKIQEQISNSDVVGFVTQPYQARLSTYLRQKRLDQKDAMIIFDQILKAIYSLYQEGYPTKNLRSQHFVLCNKAWKLQSLIYESKYKHANSVSIDYLWSPKHQAPQCFKKSIFSQEQFQSMVVWNLGCILVEMLLGKHMLSTLQTMQKFKGSVFSFAAIGIKLNISNRFSEQLKQTLEYMLHYDPKKRMRLTHVFQNKFLSSEVAKHYLTTRKNLFANSQQIRQYNQKKTDLFKFQKDLPREIIPKIQQKVKDFSKEKKQIKQVELPEYVLCPITQTLMKQPYLLTLCGHTFQESFIREWLSKQNKCPLCNKAASPQNLIKNFALAEVCRFFK